MKTEGTSYSIAGDTLQTGQEGLLRFSWCKLGWSFLFFCHRVTFGRTNPLSVSLFGSR